MLRIARDDNDINNIDFDQIYNDQHVEVMCVPPIARGYRKSRRQVLAQSLANTIPTRL